MFKRLTAALAFTLAALATPAFAASPSHNSVICPTCTGGATTVGGSEIFNDGGPLSGINGDNTSMKVTISGAFYWNGSTASYYSGPSCSAQTYNGVGGGITGSSHTATSTKITFICYATETTPFYTHRVEVFLYAFANGSHALSTAYLS